MGVEHPRPLQTDLTTLPGDATTGPPGGTGDAAGTGAATKGALQSVYDSGKQMVAGTASKVQGMATAVVEAERKQEAMQLGMTAI